ncbi:MAG: pilus assembly protein TadG-related protein [Rhodospirillales bacterium]|nr:pilus assembly protein TadG-related protein [Rhodospirillales bacterium]
MATVMMQRTKQPLSTDRFAGFVRDFRSFLGDQAGASFVITALTFPVILGLAGLGLDATMWYQDKRQNQTIVDNAAVAGTIALSRDAALTQSALETIVRDSTADNGFLHGTHGQVIVNSPPTAGPNAGNAGFVEVFVRKQGAFYFSSMVLDAAITIEARAVGGISTFGDHCVVALDETQDGAITVTGTADVTSDCGLASNSNSGEAILVSGNATLTAQPLQAYGDITKSGSATITNKAPPQPLSERLPDPYADVLTELQADASCVGANKQNFSGSDSPLSPGRYCGGIQINGNVDFLPGTYILDDGGLKIAGGGDIRGLGVTFIMTAMDASDLGTFDLSGGGLLEMRAPVDTTEGDYPGMLVIQDPYVPNVETASPGTNKFTGGSNMHLTGAIYAPHQDVDYSGGTNGGANCTLIVARKVSFHGNVYLDNDATACADAGVETIQQTRVRIME